MIGWRAHRAVAGRLNRAAATGATAVALVLVAGGILWQISSQPEVPRRSPTRLGLAPAPGENPGAVGKACLKASVLLSRRARRVGNRSDEQTMIAMSHVLDALHRSDMHSSEPLREAMLSTLTRLVDQLERDERGSTPISAPSPRTPPGAGR